VTPPDHPSNSTGGERRDDDAVCIDDYPEHDFEVQDDRDGIVTLLCRRCGAESWEESAREFGADDHAR
jgi:hypothetical protein